MNSRYTVRFRCSKCGFEVVLSSDCVDLAEPGAVAVSCYRANRHHPYGSASMYADVSHEVALSEVG